MKNVTTIVMGSLLIALGLIARSDGQQGPGAGPPSPGIALPAEQQATQGQASGLSGPGAVPNPRAGAANKMTDQNAVPSRNALAWSWPLQSLD